MSLMHIVVGKDRLTYAAPSGVKVGDLVELPLMPWQRLDDYPIEEVVGIGSDYGGEVRAVRRVLSDQEATDLRSKAAEWRVFRNALREALRCTATTLVGERCRFQGYSPYRVVDGLPVLDRLPLCDRHQAEADRGGPGRCEAFYKQSGEPCDKRPLRKPGQLSDWGIPFDGRFCRFHQSPLTRRASA